MHNHPKNGYPSATDFNTLYENPKIKYGIIVGHKGTVYKYTAPKKKIPELDIELALTKYEKKGYSKHSAKEKAFEDLSKAFGFTLEVLEK